MTYFLTFIVFFVIFSVLILVHELGHFVMARRAGIKVEEFGFGLPPRIWGFKKGETVYSINWIPFGGFVRMLGEDAHNLQMLKNKRSFISKSPRDRIKVVVAGVVMNFLLAWILLSVALSFGMQPLILPEQVFDAVQDGTIELETGLKVKEVPVESLGARAGFQVDDLIYAVDGQMLDGFLLEKLGKDSQANYQVIQFGQKRNLAVGEHGDLGLVYYDHGDFPRVKVLALDEGNPFYEAGLRAGDVITAVNGGRQVFDVDGFKKIVEEQDNPILNVNRGGDEYMFYVNLIGKTDKVVLSRVLPDSPAEKAGLKEGDVVLTVDGVSFTTGEQLKSEGSLPEKIVKYVSEHKNAQLIFQIQRGADQIFYKVKTGSDGRIGVLLADLDESDIWHGVSLYETEVMSSAVEIRDEKYPFYEAVFHAFGETFRMAELTAKMFVGFLGDLLSSGEVSKTVTGPVGIFQFTHDFIQDGWIPLIRFVAILSLSLAAINILPLPALDGGRLLFILVEVVIGRRINQRAESIIHMIGYGLLLLLILAVTFNDILNLLK